jgi:hypothetical protein
MRACVARAMLTAVREPQRVRVVIEIEEGERTISGRLAVGKAPGVAFFGWLELIDALEQAAQPASAGEGRPDRPGRGPGGGGVADA